MDLGIKVSLLVLLIVFIVSCSFIYGVTQYLALEKEIDTLNNKIFVSEMQRRMLHNDLEDLLDGKWVALKVEATGYAPLDPDAVEGMCFSGDPTITASGVDSTPGRTVAMGRSFPYGTRVYIPGIGMRVVEDRGGMIGDNNIDIMFKTKAEALAFGRQEMIVFIAN
jgi:3D (Asp-Asp-Asp) domain-containing protein